MNGDGDEDGAGAGAGTATATAVEANKEANHGNGDGSGNGAGKGTGTGVETCGRTQDGKGDRSEDGNESSSGDGNGNEDIIGEGGGEAKKRKKPQNSCRRHVGNGGDLGGKRKNRKKERVGPVAANPDNLEKNKEAGGGGDKVPRAQVRTVQVERVCPLGHLLSEIFVISIIDPPLGGLMRVA